MTKINLILLLLVTTVTIFSNTFLIKKEVDLFIKIGESNTAAAPNHILHSSELQENTRVKILNNNNLSFENLDIGSNNLLDHFGWMDNSMHGWELQWANMANKGYFPDLPIHLIHAGQGGSILAQWQTGGSYMNKFINRFKAAKIELEAKGFKVNTKFFASIGINDAIHGTNPSTFEIALTQFIQELRDVVGDDHAEFVFTELMPNRQRTININNSILSVASADQNVSTIPTSDLTLSDVNHWDYESTKVIAQRMIEESGYYRP